MSRVWRITLMWLVALAVPVQGYAAIAMFGCGPEHHGMTGTPSQVVATEEYAAGMPQHPHEVGNDPQADHHHDGSAESGHGHMLKAHGTSGKVGEGSCSPCASCCVVAALPSTMVVFQPVPLIDFFVPLAPGGAAAFLTAGPERPPRFILV